MHVAGCDRHMHALHPCYPLVINTSQRDLQQRIQIVIVTREVRADNQLALLVRHMAEVLPVDGHADKTLAVLLFTNVQNCGELQEQVVSGAIPTDCAFINATVHVEQVPDLFLLQLAARAALTADTHGKLTTRSLHAELLYNLSGSRQITESLKRYGISKGVTSMLVARFEGTPEEMARVQDVVKGEVMPLTSLGTLTDTQALQKMHKVTAEELRIGSLADAIACRMAARDAG